MNRHSQCSIARHIPVYTGPKKQREEIIMSRPVTLFTVQWGDLPLEELKGIMDSLREVTA